ncbi:MAG TPA: nucleotide exchange factor GrpE [Acidimicrobiales bacterium]|nr:nucleotide exchange factor GrpE [Acidimicrobiales bacterium]
MTGTSETPDDEVSQDADVVDAEVVDAEIVDDPAGDVAVEGEPEASAGSAEGPFVGVDPEHGVGPEGAAPEVGEVAEVIVVDDDPVAAAMAERDEYLDALRRLQAEFENYRKRVSKQQVEQVERAAVSLVDKLLPVLDVLELAAEHLGDRDSEEGKALVQSAALLNDVLAKEGLERVDPVGDPFDPNSHEAVGNVPADENELDDQGPTVAQVMRPGYRWRGAVVRPAMVLVRS